MRGEGAVCGVAMGGVGSVEDAAPPLKAREARFHHWLEDPMTGILDTSLHKNKMNIMPYEMDFAQITPLNQR